MNTKQIEELRLIWNQENGAIAFHDLLEKVEQLNQEARLQTAKEIIDILENQLTPTSKNIIDVVLIALIDKIKSKYGIGEKVGNNSK